MCHITLNKSAIFGDNGAICPGGVRIGTPAMTSRGCLEADFETIADFLHKAAQITTADLTFEFIKEATLMKLKVLSPCHCGKLPFPQDSNGDTLLCLKRCQFRYLPGRLSLYVSTSVVFLSWFFSGDLYSAHPRSVRPATEGRHGKAENGCDNERHGAVV
ncbi:hypothetical protein OIU77_025537 [Salix suchowensis]|uniref:Serine hydroxymethyltransferase-like domain-containing protein n=1 Tax=Salix suchowensis TaxID=1278906 RepID=A0ABQ9C0M1_9ROSI|nr:hypothetical protein OIU77_025537 [Salix suchowensis]